MVRYRLQHQKRNEINPNLISWYTVVDSEGKKMLFKEPPKTKDDLLELKEICQRNGSGRYRLVVDGKYGMPLHEWVVDKKW